MVLNSLQSNLKLKRTRGLQAGKEGAQLKVP